jgi:hypothetical protein
LAGLAKSGWFSLARIVLGALSDTLFGFRPASQRYNSGL